MSTKAYWATLSRPSGEKNNDFFFCNDVLFGFISGFQKTGVSSGLYSQEISSDSNTKNILAFPFGSGRVFLGTSFTSAFAVKPCLIAFKLVSSSIVIIVVEPTLFRF